MQTHFRLLVLAIAIMTTLSVQMLAQTGMPQPILGARSFSDKETGCFAYQFFEKGGGFLVFQKAPEEVRLPYEWSVERGMVYHGKQGDFTPRREVFVVIEKTESGFNVAEMKVDRQKLDTYLDRAGQHYTIAELKEYLSASK
jgi:hypothetical protein